MTWKISAVTLQPSFLLRWRGCAAAAALMRMKTAPAVVVGDRAFQKVSKVLGLGARGVSYWVHDGGARRGEYIACELSGGHRPAQHLEPPAPPPPNRPPPVVHAPPSLRPAARTRSRCETSSGISASPSLRWPRRGSSVTCSIAALGGERWCRAASRTCRADYADEADPTGRAADAVVAAEVVEPGEQTRPAQLLCRRRATGSPFRNRIGVAVGLSGAVCGSTVGIDVSGRPAPGHQHLALGGGVQQVGVGGERGPRRDCPWRSGSGAPRRWR